MSERILLMVVIILCVAGHEPRTLAQTGQDAAVRSLVEKFFLAFQKEELAPLMSMWSEQSPDRVSSRQSFQNIFNRVDKIQITNLVIRKVTFDSDRATVRVACEMAALDAKSGAAATGFGRLNRTLQLVKEGAEWRVSSYIVSEEVLARALTAVKLDQDRRALLEQEPELVNIELVKALGRRGGALVRQGGFAEALLNLDLARHFADQLGSREWVARVWLAIGELHETEGEYAKALEADRKGLSLAEEVGDKAGVANSLNQIANIYLRQGRYADASEHFDRSLKIAQDLGDLAIVARVLHNIGLVHMQQDRHPQALEYYSRSLKYLEQMANESGIGEVMNSMGLSHNKLGAYEKALECYDRSLKIAEKLGDKRRIARSLTNIASVDRARGDFAGALANLQKSLNLLETGNRADIALTLGNMGVLYSLVGNYSKALECLQKSLAFAQESASQSRIAESLLNIGTVYYYQASYHEAMRFFNEALALAEKLGIKSVAASSLSNIGLIHSAEGNYDQALEFHFRSLRVSEESGDKGKAAATLLNVGSAFGFLGDYPRALDSYQRVLKIAEEMGIKDSVAQALNNIGVLKADQGNYADALRTLHRSLALFEEIGDKASTAHSLAILASTLVTQREYQKAVELAGRAASLAEEIDSPANLLHAKTVAGNAYRQLGQAGQAREAVAAAIRVAEELRDNAVGSEDEHQRFFEKRIDPYYLMVDLAMEQDSPGDALSYAELAKGRVLLDLLRKGKVDITKAMTQAEQQQEQSLNARIISLNSQIYNERNRPGPQAARLSELRSRLKETRLEYASFRTSLYAAHPELRLQRGTAEPFRVDQAASLLSDGATAMLEYVVGTEKTYLFVLTKGSGAQGRVELRAYSIGVSRKDLSARILAYREAVATRNLDFGAAARGLYDLLLKPAEKQLAGVRTLCIVPDGVLWELPFQSLQPREAFYLLQDYSIFYAPSLSVLREIVKARKRETTGAATVLAFGNPSLARRRVSGASSMRGEEKLSPLLEAEREVQALVGLYGAANCRVLIGAEAREEIAKAEAAKYRILHFATHGRLEDNNPMYSHVVLSQAGTGTDEDGLLEAREIVRMDLKSEIVVLSACQTARGRVSAGEGVVGMSWAWFVAGCPTTVVSQWEVDSASTRQLMVEFHRGLAGGAGTRGSSLSRAEALRLAALSLLKESRYRHPFYWAAFVIVGDGR
jgi:CHAT domain-containing protein/Tfp pilus assembly protein PilF